MLRILPLLLLLPTAAVAQVSVNSGALDQLKPSAPSSSAPAGHKPAPHHAASHHSAHAERTEHTTHPAHAEHGSEHPAAEHHPAPTQASASAPHAGTTHPPPAGPQAPVTIAPAPPSPAVLPPPTLSPQAHPAPPPALAPVVTDAAGVATEIPGGVRVTFGDGKADLNASTDAALHSFAKTVAANPAETVNVYAYASGTPDDPSTPRRVSLSRALAARAILINEGIASTRIYPRALGATPSDGPADRVDVTVVGAAPAPGAPATTPPASALPPAVAPPVASTPPAPPAAH